MLNVLLWLITVEIIGLAVFPLAYFLLPKLSDRGYGLSKPLGVLLIGYAAWILSVLHLVPSVRLTLVGLVVLLAGGSGVLAYLRRDEIIAFVKRRWRLIAVTEVVFLVVFLGWMMFRAYDPAINHTEQPMDFAFLNASIESTTGQPEDPWLRGESISYYYFGYWMMGVVSELSGVASHFSYNLSLALVPAMAAAAVLCLVVSMVRAACPVPRHGDRGPLEFAVFAGVGAGLLLIVISNIEGVLEFMYANSIGSQGFYDWLGIQGLDGPTEIPTDSWNPNEFWWWFRATRVINTFVDGSEIDYTIQEFPFFSFMLGDLHPHVSAIPFALLAAGFALNFFRSEATDLRRIGPWGYATIAAMAVSLGGLAFTNMWDLPTYAALLVGIAALKAYAQPPTDAASEQAPSPLMGEGEDQQNESEDRWLEDAASEQAPSPLTGEGWGEGEDQQNEMYDGRIEDSGESAEAVLKRVGLAVIQTPLIVIALAFALYLPYYLGFTSSVQGIGAVVTPSRYFHLFLVWGTLLVFVAPFIVACFWQTIVGPDWRRMTMISLAVAFLPLLLWMVVRLQSTTPSEGPTGRFIHILPLALLIAMAVWSAIHETKLKGPTGKGFALALGALGLLLIMGPELMYVDDFFDDPRQRMNTVFKLYYQAWILLAAVSGYSIYFWLSTRHRLTGRLRKMSTVWAVAAIALVVCGLYYPAAAAATKVEEGGFASRPTLDGLAYVRDGREAEYAAIQFIKDNLPDGSAIVESVGEWYEAGLISRSTGVPTVFNWPGHEIQWRGSDEAIGGRQSDVAAIYTTSDPERARILMSRYDVDYVYVGPREILAHDGPGLDKFPEFMDTVFQQDDVTIYKLRE